MTLVEVAHAVELAGIPIHAENKLGEVVASDGESVAEGGEPVGLQHDRRYFHHEPDLEGRAGDEPFGLEDGPDLLHFPQGPNEGDDDREVGEAEGVPDFLHGAAFEAEALFVVGGDIPGRSPPAEHGVGFKGLDVLSAP